MASSTILEGLEVTSEHINGEHASIPEPDSKARSQILIIKQAIDKILRKEISRGSVVKQEDDKEDNNFVSTAMDGDTAHERGLVLTLNSMTEKGPKPLYTGLQCSSGMSHAVETMRRTYADVDANILPNGMTVIEPVALHAHRKLKESKDRRTIGQVFPPHRNLKSLEAPQPPRSSSRDSALQFVEAGRFDGFAKAKATYKSDYKFASLPTGQWLQYKNSPTADKADGDREDATGQDQTKIKALFQAAYSSFAPTVDNSTAVIPETTRSQLWWDKAGKSRFETLFSSIQYPEADLNSTSLLAGKASPVQDDFETALTNFEAEENPLADSLENTDATEKTQKDTEYLLADISALLETLSSYQQIRNLAPTPRPGVGTEPSKGAASPSSAEFDTYEILKSQLTLLIDSLPPFAVARLNGDQLEALNISTRMVVDSYDYPGSMEADEQTLQRRRAAAAAAAAASRTVTASVGRPGTYQTPAAAAANYNRGAYNANTARPPYQQPTRPYATAYTPAQSYQTPRPSSSTSQRPSYGQQPYQPSTAPAYNQGTSVQQFQRPMQNGYGNYAGTPTQPGYAQRPTQPGYQQRAQDNAQNYGRSASPQKPVMNGQQPYYPTRQPQPSQPSYATPRTASVSYSGNDQQAAIERAKLAQQQHLQRQSSGTPQTPGYSYDGAAERRETSNGAPVTAGTA